MKILRLARDASLAGVLVAGVVAGAGPWPAAAQTRGGSEPGAPASTKPKALEGVSYAQRLDNQLPLDLPFVDETGAPVRLGQYFGTRPVVLALVYYECPMLCTQVLSGLTSGLKGMQFSAGDEFDVVVVSFDPGEGPGLAAAKKATYLQHYNRQGTAQGWHFLTGRKADIDVLSESVGFSYTYDEKTDQYAHGAGITIATPAGRIARYFFGIDFAPRDLRLGIVEASDGTIGSAIDSVLLYCYHYDPSTGTYGLMALNIVRAGGILTVVAMASGFVVLRRRERRGAFGGPAGPPRGSHKA